MRESAAAGRHRCPAGRCRRPLSGGFLHRERNFCKKSYRLSGVDGLCLLQSRKHGSGPAEAPAAGTREGGQVMREQLSGQLISFFSGEFSRLTDAEKVSFFREVLEGVLLNRENAFQESLKESGAELLSVMIPAQVYQKLLQFAEESGVAGSRVVSEALEEYLAKRAGEPG